jgi:hypothetical protein
LGELAHDLRARRGRQTAPPPDIADALVRRFQKEQDPAIQGNMLHAMIHVGFAVPGIKALVQHALEQWQEHPFIVERSLEALLTAPLASIQDESEFQLWIDLLIPLITRGYSDTLYHALALAAKWVDPEKNPGRFQEALRTLRANRQMKSRLKKLLQDPDESIGILVRRMGSALGLGPAFQERPFSPYAFLESMRQFPLESSLSALQQRQLFDQINKSSPPADLLRRFFEKGARVIFISSKEHAVYELGVLTDAAGLRQTAGLTHFAVPLPPSSAGSFQKFLQGADEAEFARTLDEKMGWVLRDVGEEDRLPDQVQRFRARMQAIDREGIQFVFYGAEEGLKGTSAFSFEMQQLMRAYASSPRSRMIVSASVRQDQFFSKMHLRTQEQSLSYSHAAAFTERLGAGNGVVSILEETREDWEEGRSFGMHNLEDFLNVYSVSRSVGLVLEESVLDPLRFDYNFLGSYGEAWNAVLLRVSPDQEGRAPEPAPEPDELLIPAGGSGGAPGGQRGRAFPPFRAQSLFRAA